MIKYYILDSETTGLNPNYHEIIELSVIRFDDRFQLSKNIKASYPRRYNQASLSLTGRKPEDLYKGAPKDKVVDLFNSFFEQDNLSPKERCIIAFVAHFDRNFCYKMWDSVGKVFPAENWLDAKNLGKTIAKNQGLIKPKLNLDNCLKIAGIEPVPGAHTAQGDTRNTYLLVKKAIEQGLDLISLIKHAPQTTKEEKIENWSSIIECEDLQEDNGSELDIPKLC